MNNENRGSCCIGNYDMCTYVLEPACSQGATNQGKPYLLICIETLDSLVHLRRKDGHMVDTSYGDTLSL
jgi:hypothetical protein